jgi:proline dehydrogenase
MSVSFDNTEIAFKIKNNSALRKANFLFGIINNSTLVKASTSLASMALNLHLPIKWAIKATIFQQFCGGESLTESKPVVDELKKLGVLSILDYAIEAKSGEAEFDNTLGELINVINYASTANVPFVSAKVTGLARFELLEKLQNKATLTVAEQEEFRRVKDRVNTLCKTAAEKNIALLVDAEETWIQDPVDALTNGMMLQYNKTKAIVYNTVQLYRHDRFEYLKKCIQLSKENNFVYGIKLVRGAYMEKERKRATQMNYPSPIQPNKEATDIDFDNAVEVCINSIDHVAFFCASHNEASHQKAVELMKQKGLSAQHPNIYFSQLYGMSDHITFNMANAGYNACKYLPFGPVADVMPYLIRRAQENTSIAGQMSRELKLIKSELNRRK